MTDTGEKVRDYVQAIAGDGSVSIVDLEVLLTSIYGAVDELEVKLDIGNLELGDINLNTDDLEALQGDTIAQLVLILAALTGVISLPTVGILEILIMTGAIMQVPVHAIEQEVTLAARNGNVGICYFSFDSGLTGVTDGAEVPKGVSLPLKIANTDMIVKTMRIMLYIFIFLTS